MIISGTAKLHKTEYEQQLDDEPSTTVRFKSRYSAGELVTLTRTVAVRLMTAACDGAVYKNCSNFEYWPTMDGPANVIVDATVPVNGDSVSRVTEKSAARAEVSTPVASIGTIEQTTVCPLATVTYVVQVSVGSAFVTSVHVHTHT